eukprot:10329925-Ditylum_brightwellii.AAC.1
MPRSGDNVQKNRKNADKGYDNILYHYIQDEKNGLTKLLPHKRVTVKEEMEEYLLEHHQRHFSQATPTPFAQAPLKDLIGYT